MQQPWGAKEEGASGSSCCLPEPQALLSTSLCCTQPWALCGRTDDAGEQLSSGRRGVASAGAGREEEAFMVLPG